MSFICLDRVPKRSDAELVLHTDGFGMGLDAADFFDLVYAGRKGVRVLARGNAETVRGALATYTHGFDKFAYARSTATVTR